MCVFHDKKLSPCIHSSSGGTVHLRTELWISGCQRAIEPKSECNAWMNNYRPFCLLSTIVSLMCSPRSSVLQSHLPLGIFCISVPWVRHACSSATPLMPSQESIFPQCEYRNGNYSCVSLLPVCVSLLLWMCFWNVLKNLCVTDPQIWQLLCQCYGGWQTCQLRPLGYSRTRGLWSPKTTLLSPNGV